MKKAKREELDLMENEKIARMEHHHHKKKKSLSKHDLEVIKPLTNAQEEMMKSYMAGSSILATGSAGTGKAQPLDSLVRTPSGWEKIGNLVIGDEIVCPDGSITKVNGVFPQGKKDTYAFIFEDGRIVECCTEHLWLIENYKWDTPRVLEASDLKEKIDTLSPKYFNSFKVPLIEHESKDDVKLPLDPYFLGIMLGDGCLSAGTATFSSADKEIINYVDEYIGESYKLTEHKSSPYDFTIAKVERNSYIKNDYVERLKELGLMNKLSYEKFIPSVYKNSSKQQKHELLSGLIDSDGEADENGSLYYHTTSEILKNDVVEIIRSLGGLAYVKERQNSYYYNGKTRLGRKSYRIRMRYRESYKLSKLSRKLINMKETNQYKDCGMKIIDILDNGEKECVCISVEHPDHLYITNDYTTTHNTFIGLFLALNDLLDKNTKYRRINIIRSVVATRDIGFLPGDMEEKIEVYETPYIDMFSDLFGGMPTCYKKFKELGKVNFMPTSFLRGQTWDDTIVVVDEAQNMNFHEINTIMTRIGHNSKVIIVGDSNQTDLFKTNKDCSYMHELERVLRDNRFFDTVNFTKHDIVRSEFVKSWIECTED